MRLTYALLVLVVVALSAEARAQSDGKADKASTNPARPKVQPRTPSAGAIPTNIRLRRLEQRVRALKERAWRAKARVGMLEETVLGSGVGARASIVHANKMGGSYRLLSLKYVLDGTQIFFRSDPSGELHKQKTFDVMTGPIAPGNHTLNVIATYRGHGYGPIKYINKYRFKVRASHTFTAVEGKGIRVRVVGFEKGGVSTPLERRPNLEFKETVVDATKPAGPKAKGASAPKAKGKAKTEKVKKAK